MQDIVPQKSLKEIEANLLLDITESTISFDIDHQWTNEEYEEMLYYCRADVNALRPLFEARKEYFETKFDICMLCKINPEINVGLTNAKLCSKFLNAKMVIRDDERDYHLPKTIDTNFIDKRILEFFKRIYDMSIPSDELFKSKLEFEEHGMPTVVSWGGKHGALLNFIYDVAKTPNYIVINADFESLYPHILALEEYNTISRNIEDSKAYYNTLQMRLKLKHEGKKKEQLALKLILNTTYGCELNQYNDLYDPRGSRTTCINGQLLISELTERIYRIGEVKLIQVNTDGIMVMLPKEKLDEYYKVCGDFSKKVKINLEYDIIDKIIQRDVNNYILYMKDGDHYKIKAKGGEFSNLPNLKMDLDKNITSKYVPNFKTNSMAIVSEAIARYLLIGTPVEETINNCNEIHMFQQVSHLGSTYEKCVQESVHGDIELQRNNRIYAGKTPSGTIIKIKPNGRRDSLANCPPNPIVDNSNKLVIDDINKMWYIEYANEKVNDFLGIKRLEDYKKEELLELAKEYNIEVDKKTKKDKLIELIKERKRNGEKEKMTKKQETEIENTVNTPVNEYDYEMLERQDKISLSKKINNFRKLVHERKFVLDKAMTSNLGGEEYHSIGQYYNAVQELCVECGLDFCFDIVNETRFERDIIKPATGAPRHLSTVKCVITLTDIDTGYDKCYEVLASGSDTTDKGISGACTLAFRNWFKFNFTPKSEFEWDDNQNNVEQVKESEPKVPAYIPPKAKEEITKKVVEVEQHVDSDEEDKNYIIENIYKLRDAMENPNYGETVLKAVTEGNPNSAQILSYKTSIKARLLEYKDKLGE